MHRVSDLSPAGGLSPPFFCLFCIFTHVRLHGVQRCITAKAGSRCAER
jgi:hypothetical protein